MGVGRSGSSSTTVAGASDRARLTIYEGPVLTGDQLGLGRGWANVTREGEDVTERLLAEAAHPPPVAELKRELVERSADGPIAFGAVVELAGERYPQSRVSERVALCEQAVWELLHEGAVELTRDGAPVARRASGRQCCSPGRRGLGMRPRS